MRDSVLSFLAHLGQTRDLSQTLQDSF